MKELFTHLYPREKGYIPTHPIEFPHRTFNSSFSLNDKKACTDCTNKGEKFTNCNQSILKVCTQKEVNVLHFEKFINQFEGTSAAIIGDRCDFILYDEQKIAFCDVTCSSPKWIESNDGRYPQGKRAKVYEQVSNSLGTLLSVTLLETRILSYTFRIGIFGWRDRDAFDVTDDAMANMMTFIETPSSKEDILYSEAYVMGHGFSFVEIKYPQQYMWDEDIMH